MSDDVYEIYAIRYGYHDRRSSECFLGGDPHDQPMPLNYYVWLIRNGARTIVFDTGFNERAAAERGRQMVCPVADGLKSLGVDPGGVEDVVISHMHYDHAGNVDLFPKARLHLQDREMAFATGRCMCHPVMRHSFDPHDVSNVIHRLFGGCVSFHDGAGDLAPGISLHLIGGHSKGLQCMRVKTRRGHMVLASDAAHFYAHLRQRRVFPTVYNVGDVLEGYDKLVALASAPDLVIPGHDPLVMALYPAQGSEAVRLDADPRPSRD
jgi:glyoxylase-like metal-dependent hydrolase (beta-lactamase superfamily II)